MLPPKESNITLYLISKWVIRLDDELSGKVIERILT